MQLREILHEKSKKIHPILAECSEFINESNRLPILKNLPIQYNDFHKVKVRQRKRMDEFTHTFNEAFDEIPNLRQRSVATNGEISFIAEKEGKEPFFIFPVDGYKYKYSLEVTNSKEDYQQAFDTILEMLEDKEVMELLLKYTYTSKNLKEGINHGAEIMFYNISHFYAIRASKYDNYSDLLEKISGDGD